MNVKPIKVELIYFLNNHKSYVDLVRKLDHKIYSNDPSGNKIFKMHKHNVKMENTFPRGYKRMMRKSIRKLYHGGNKIT